MIEFICYPKCTACQKAKNGWITNELNCDLFDTKDIKAENLKNYDTGNYGGGLYAGVIAGVNLITKNILQF